MSVSEMRAKSTIAASKEFPLSQSVARVASSYASEERELLETRVLEIGVNSALSHGPEPAKKRRLLHEL